ncbi:MAG: FHA domain-containing protein [Bdellovibrionaceae bacterium]|nr:FHA domain-containing protein [Pseudobdellovibrionaceae bacterium]MBX3032729.1 FHA domain-containing protein [Pseudobdellovibrionaceae bacterium]
MARLKVKLRGKTVSEIPLSEERQYLAGRKDDCDIILQGEKGISREHFRLVANGDAWTLEALSRFGEVSVGGEKVSNLVLEHGTVFNVPPYEFEFLMTTADSAMPEARPEAELPAPSSDFAAEGGFSDIADASEKTVVGVAPSVPYIKFMDGNGEARELIRLEGGDSWIAGRDSSCNIHIRDSRVSRRQFEIRKQGSSYSIIDMGSVNGTLLNGTPISTNDPTPLKSGDAITVLENYLYFELHDPNFKSRLDLVNLQPAEVVDNPLVPMSENPLPPSAYPAYQPAPWGQGMPVPYDPNMMPPPVMPPPAAPAPSGKFDYQKHRPRLILGAIAIVALVFAFNGNDESDLEGPPAEQSAQDPLSKLTPEQKKLVEDTYQLSSSYYMQGKYEFAKSELLKMTELTPEYKDSPELMKRIEEALYVQLQMQKQEQFEKNQREQEEKIQRKAAECRGTLNDDTTRDAMETCLSEVLPFNPEHALFRDLFNEIERRQAEKATKLAADAAHRAEIERLRGLYGQAKKLEEGKKPLTAIRAYERVLAAALPDPGGLKGAARERINALKDMINSRTADLQKAAEQSARDGRLKEAIYSLRRAKQVDPQNESLDGKIDQLRLRLQEDMMRIYQEGVLDESFGNVDGDDTHPGAKQKWKKILDTDVEDGEYYKKALIKLKKYGSPR